MIGNSNKLISTIRSVTKPPLGFRDKVCLVGLCESSEMVRKTCYHVTTKHSNKKTVPLVRVGITLNEIKTGARSALWLVGSNEPTNRSANRSLVSFLFNEMQTHTKSTGIYCQSHCEHLILLKIRGSC